MNIYIYIEKILAHISIDIIEQYQAQPHLLDPHLESLFEICLSQIISHSRSSNIDSNLPSGSLPYGLPLCLHESCKYLFYLIKVYNFILNCYIRNIKFILLSIISSLFLNLFLFLMDSIFIITLLLLLK